MDFGDRMVQVRKEKRLSREELGKRIDTSGAIIGRYERNEMRPSIDVAMKIAEVLEVSLDYLVGNSSITVKDKKTIERLELINQMPDAEKKQLFNVVDALLRDFQAKQAFGLTA